MGKYIVGIGCSWTQGEGGYPDEIVQKYNGRVQHHFRQPGNHESEIAHYEIENSWVNQLCRDHFPDHTPLNLGIKGIGNRAAVHQLYFVDNIDWNTSEGIIIFMLSGFERFDFFNQTPMHDDYYTDGYSDDTFAHHKWRTMWPYPIESTEGPLWDVYGRMLWSEQFQACEQMMALLDLQIFAKAHNFKLIVANGFNQYHDLIGYLKEHAGTLVDKFDWSSYIHNTTEYTSFMQRLVELDGKLSNWHEYYNFYKKLDKPSEYLTNCDGAHPTIKGYKVIADELATFIRKMMDK